jgi:hypothetical protein
MHSIEWLSFFLERHQIHGLVAKEIVERAKTVGLGKGAIPLGSLGEVFGESGADLQEEFVREVCPHFRTVAVG